MTVAEARAHLADGQFPAGQHGPQDRGGRPVRRGRAGARRSSPRSSARPRRWPGAPAPGSPREHAPPLGPHLAPAAGGRGVPAASARARALLEDPQGFGNYMTYRDAYRILGWDPAEIYRDGAIALDRSEWADLGWMANHIGPSPRRARRHARGGRRGARRALLARPRRAAARPDGRGAARPRPRRRLRRHRHRGRPGRASATRPSRASTRATRSMVTDPGYFHFVPALRLAGGEPVWVRLGARPTAGGSTPTRSPPRSPRARRWWWSATRSTRSGRCSAATSSTALLRAVGRARDRDPGRHHPLGPPRRPGGRATTPSPPWPPSTRGHAAGGERPGPRLRHGRGAGRRARRRPRAGAGLPPGEDRGRAPQHQPARPGGRGGGPARRRLGARAARRSSAATSPPCARSPRP